MKNRFDSAPSSKLTKGQHPDFVTLGLCPTICRAILRVGYHTPTPIQSAAIPRALRGQDLVGCAQTGTGKTAAFVLPILQHLSECKTLRGSRSPRALILAPTRELAAQIGESIGKFANGTSLQHCVVFGGVGKTPQMQFLRRGVDIVVATPGRLLDLLDERALSLGRVSHVVLDEADRMLDMGFIRDVRRIMALVPSQRQTLVFSATMPAPIEELAKRVLRHPTRITVDPVSTTRDLIDQSVCFVETHEKIPLLIALIRSGEIDRALVFTRTKHGANRVAQRLLRANIGASAIHGNKSQKARTQALAQFKSGRTCILVATDVASRGIDVKCLSHVINFDMPKDPESYVHRVGRTGRAGETGVAISFCSAADRSELAAIERLTEQRLQKRDASMLVRKPDSASVESPPQKRLRATRSQRAACSHQPALEKDRVSGSQRGGPRSGGEVRSTSRANEPTPTESTEWEDHKRPLPSARKRKRSRKNVA